MRTRQRIIGLAATVGLVAAGLIASPVATAKTSSEQITACVNKKTGAMRLLTKGKCKKKKERTLSWWVGQAPVKLTDANGTVIPDVTSVNGQYFQRFVDGYFFEYNTANGKLFAYNSSFGASTYLNADCTGPAYWEYEAPGTYGAPNTIVLTSDGGVTKTVYTTPNPTVTVPSGTNISYRIDGACEAYQITVQRNFGELVPLAITPTEYVGPIRVTRQ